MFFFSSYGMLVFYSADFFKKSKWNFQKGLHLNITFFEPHFFAVRNNCQVLFCKGWKRCGLLIRKIFLRNLWILPCCAFQRVSLLCPRKGWLFFLLLRFFLFETNDPQIRRWALLSISKSSKIITIQPSVGACFSRHPWKVPDNESSLFW